MKQIRIEEATKFEEILREIQNAAEEEIEIRELEPGLLDVLLNKQAIILLAERLNKKIHFKLASSREAKAGESEHGFVEGKDVAEEKIEEKPEEKISVKTNRFAFLKPILKNKKITFGVLALVVIFIILGISLFLLPSATVVVDPNEEFKEEELNLVASQSATQIDLDEDIIPLEEIQLQKEDSIEKDATGTKEIGNPAKGRINIINRDSSGEKTFFKGTTVSPVSGSTVAFTLDEAATVSAAPAGCGSGGEECPSIGVDVTATSIGEAGNLAAGTVFRVGDANVDLVFARNDTNFAGGSSEQVKIVSADDRNKAKDELLAKLREEAIKEMAEENPDAVIPENGVEVQIVNEIYSQEIGAEAENFRLTLQVNFIAKAFSEEDLKEFLVAALSENTEEEFEVNDENLEISSEILGQGAGDFRILGKIKAQISPSLDQENLKQNLAGKTFAQADSFLKSQDNISGYEIKISPNFFRAFARLPFSANKIRIELKE